MLIVNPADLLELITVVYVKIWSGQFPVLPKPDTLPKKPLCHFCSQHFSEKNLCYEILPGKHCI